MDYLQALQFLFDLPRSRIGPGTTSTARILAHLDDPHLGNKYIHITGSNGKGSTSRMVASILTTSGLKVGLYTSPHLVNFKERITIDDRPIPNNYICDFANKIHSYIETHEPNIPQPTFFEVTTALALWYFHMESVDVAVIEVGIGGKHDATSVIDPICSAVTNVSLEHTEILGSTIEDISKDKASIATNTSPLITAAKGVALKTIKKETKEVLSVGEEGEVSITYGGSSFSESTAKITTPSWELNTKIGLIGYHQSLNAGVAAKICQQTFNIDPETISHGLRNTHWPGRFEIFNRNPLVILDGAHNSGAFVALNRTLAEFKYNHLFIVFGALSDKNHSEMISFLPPSKAVYVSQPNISRSANSSTILELFEKQGRKTILTNSIDSAMDQALSVAGKNDCVLVTGSLYTIREARQKWSNYVINKTPHNETEIFTFKTQMLPEQAHCLQKQLLSIGGTCNISLFDKKEEEFVETTFSGTIVQLNSLIDSLSISMHKSPSLLNQLSGAIKFQNSSIATNNFPWKSNISIMGILNMTPDSFYDGGVHNTIDKAISKSMKFIEFGADIIDIGGESTRPGASDVSSQIELNRILPIIEELSSSEIPLSVDTRSSKVAKAAINSGADIINDVSGLSDPNMRFVASDLDVPIVLTHSIDTPIKLGKKTHYGDVVEDVLNDLSILILKAENAGVDRSNIIIDPGIGFGKTPIENFELIRRLNEFKSLGCPILVGHSHKSLFSLLNIPPDQRLSATIATTALMISRGANILRVHDVKENLDAVRIAQNMQ